MNDHDEALENLLLTMNQPNIKTATVVHPPENLRVRLFDRVFPPDKVTDFLKEIPNANATAIVVADCEGLIEWVSPAFSRMCGYSLEELRGHKAGKLLQGAETDPTSVENLRQAVRECRPVEVTIINYHKEGTLYEVLVHLHPTYHKDGTWTGFIAIENEV